MERSHRGPDVRVPPPLFFVGGWLLAWWLNRQLTIRIDAEGAALVQEVAGVLLLVGGLGLMFWAVGMFGRARTPIVPIRPARVLVEAGPYRFTRNPMYLGIATGYVGLAVLLNLVWPLIVLPFVLIALRLAAIRREERYLDATFGQAYREYCARVRRWI
jgi:protein-S-isoprenylcysteine O-methyltransferase Ste14